MFQKIRVYIFSPPLNSILFSQRFVTKPWPYFLISYDWCRYLFSWSVGKFAGKATPLLQREFSLISRDRHELKHKAKFMINFALFMVRELKFIIPPVNIYGHLWSACWFLEREECRDLFKPLVSTPAENHQKNH